MLTLPPDLKLAISGDLGSGKSTICKLLRDNLGFRLFSMGEAWRELAEQRQMSILELNKYSETHPLDEAMDQKMAALADAPENIIFDSRLAWHFIPNSFKIHLTVDPEIAARRVFNDKRRGDAEEYVSLAEAQQKILERKVSENQRYLSKYGIDCSNMANYNLVIDTSLLSPEEIVAKIIAALKNR